MELQDDDEPKLLGFITANIVALNHCPGTFTGHGMVLLSREPLNPSDPNAIQVHNRHAEHFGYIERTVASVLSPLIDSDDVIVEGIVPNQTSNSNRSFLPCQLHVFTKLHSFPTVRDAIQRGNLQLVTQDNPSFTLSASQAVVETKAQRRYKNFDKIFRLVDQSLQNNDRALYALEPPPHIIKTELLDHQKEGLGWLLNREDSNELPPFWEKRARREFVNVLTQFKTSERPKPLRGGILADAMGLGKTLTLLSLIAVDKSRGFGGNVGKKSYRKGSDSGKRARLMSDSSIDDGLVETNATLVVCTPSVMTTWVTELEQHTNRGSLSSDMYHGGERTRDAYEFKKYDLVLTTYPTLSTDKSLPLLEKVQWRRVILDEAHHIKNFKCKQSRAVMRLNAQRRWAVTGTPIQNGSLDLFAFMEFLHFEPFSTRSTWRKLVQTDLNIGLDRGLMRLQVLMDAISLCRTKDYGLAGLPPKTVETHRIELDSEERELYDEVFEVARNRVLSYFGTCGDSVRHYSEVLSMILRLRQICTDMALCPEPLASGFASDESEDDVPNKPELLQKLIETMQEGEDFDCPICMSPSIEMVITRCSHIICRPCIMKTLDSCKSRCPFCREPLTKSDLISAPLSTGPSSSSKPRLSSKTSALIKLLVESRDKNLASKSVVFSQFRKMLLLLEEPLHAAGFQTMRLDGSMSVKARTKVINQFQSSRREGPVVLLASLRASSEGINLTAANRVYFMEPWWNPAVEEQAMDRVHRIGQKKAVKIVRFIAKDSIEEKILQLQEKKAELARVKVSRRQNEKNAGMNLTDIDFLLSV